MGAPAPLLEAVVIFMRMLIGAVSLLTNLGPEWSPDAARASRVLARAIKPHREIGPAFHDTSALPASHDTMLSNFADEAVLTCSFQRAAHSCRFFH